MNPFKHLTLALIPAALTLNVVANDAAALADAHERGDPADITSRTSRKPATHEGRDAGDLGGYESGG